MYSIQFSPMAKKDILRIKLYLEEEYDTATAAVKIKQLLKNIKRFEEFPLLGRPLMNVIDIPTDYMFFCEENNYVFYRLEKETVKIIRIIYTRQDFMNILFGDR